MKDIHVENILILDFGSQYTQLIARRVRELGVFCEIHSYENAAKAVNDMKPKGIILSGGPQSTTLEDSARLDESLYALGLPILGICYGMQTMALQLGGETQGSAKKEFGHAKIQLQGQSPLFKGIDSDTSDVWMSHGDKVTTVPESFTVLATTDSTPIAAMCDEARQFYGLQFHPEVTHSKDGQTLLKNFILDICDIDPLWQADNIIEQDVISVRKKVGNKKVLLALSGGVDSSVLACLLHKAIGDKLHCVFVDTGLLRLNEGDKVMEMFSHFEGMNITRVNAEETFLTALKGIADPEAKRKIIGKTFIDVFELEAKKIKDIAFLAQGTIYPDVIESAKTTHSEVIKSHHNVGGLPERLNFDLLEPFRELFKDEVRKLGVKLGLPDHMVYRHPFPGPGLGVRVLGEIKEEYCDILRLADDIFIEELHKNGWYEKTSQAFAVFLPVKSVGVMGDGRKYDHVIALRAVETSDFMTAHWAHIPHEVLGHISNRIINEVDRVTRVTYDISGKPPATIEWE